MRNFRNDDFTKSYLVGKANLIQTCFHETLILVVSFLKTVGNEETVSWGWTRPSGVHQTHLCISLTHFAPLASQALTTGSLRSPGHLPPTFYLSLSWVRPLMHPCLTTYFAKTLAPMVIASFRGRKYDDRTGDLASPASALIGWEAQPGVQKRYSPFGEETEENQNINHSLTLALILWGSVVPHGLFRNNLCGQVTD